MSGYTPMKTGFPTIPLNGTATSQVAALGNTNASYVIIHNAGSNPIFVNSGTSTATIVFPSAASQNGAIIGAGTTATYMKNNPKDTHLAFICGSGLTTQAYAQSGEGI